MSLALYQKQQQLAVIELNNPPLNSLGYELRLSINERLQDALIDPSIKAIVVTSAHNTFSAGADIREFGLPAATSEPSLRDLISQFESSHKPIIAAIQGFCAGGGLELAMAAHYRVTEPNSEFAFPEVKLGLIPGAGGTQKLPRAIGIEAALKMMLHGDFIKGGELASTNLIDQLIEGPFLKSAIDFANLIVNQGSILKRLRDIELSPVIFSDELEKFLLSYKKNFIHYPAPLAIIDSVKDAMNLPYYEAIKHERARFIELSNSPSSRALRHAFFAPRACQNIPAIDKSIPNKSIKSVGIIGSGTMGTGIAINFLNAHINTIILDQSHDALAAGTKKIRQDFEARVKKSRLSSAESEYCLGHLRTGTSYDDLKEVDFVIEAAFEDLDVKKSIFRELDQVTKQDAILATNTSTLDIDQIAACCSKPSNVIGLHFFSPANVMKLVEVIRTKSTSNSVIATTFSLAKKIDKIAVLSRVCDGFIGNRMLEHYGRMARILVEEGALPWEVDAALEQWGMAMGPFRVFDLAGNDIALAVRKRRYIEKPHIRYGKVADDICLAGRYGQKTNQGWYRYEPGSRTPIPDPEVEKIIHDYQQRNGITPRKFTPEEIVNQCIFALINEGARIIEDGIALRASDIDVVYLTGYGFPRFRGGPMQYADEIGLQEVVNRLNSLYEQTQDPFWKPASILLEYSLAGKKFNSI